MQLQRPLPGIGHDPFRGEPQAERQHQGHEGKDRDAEILNRPHHGGRQQYDAYEPAGERKRIEEGEIESGALKHSLRQNHGVQEGCAPTQRQRPSLGTDGARAGATQTRGKPATRQ